MPESRALPTRTDDCFQRRRLGPAVVSESAVAYGELRRGVERL